MRGGVLPEAFGRRDSRGPPDRRDRPPPRDWDDRQRDRDFDDRRDRPPMRRDSWEDRGPPRRDGPPPRRPSPGRDSEKSAPSDWTRHLLTEHPSKETGQQLTLGGAKIVAKPPPAATLWTALEDLDEVIGDPGSGRCDDGDGDGGFDHREERQLETRVLPRRTPMSEFRSQI